MIKKRILICDDDQDILDLTSLILEDDYEVATEVDSTRLIRQAEAFKPDLILLDMWMPKITGDQLVRFLKKLPNLQHIPVVIFSASSDGNQKAMEAGANGFLAKPFDIDELIRIVSEYCPMVSGGVV
ncbi:response regulator [Mucilaginibacter daejeonensis]|uniref:response regulator n=1 Tax=Mucilaginibacter daejeonensis TaxID=398049 RepID=UPI001D1779AB|nr:response regulator [Mucilaginibacter daejeonensis]UEG51930.1 response regulator [Mucilaginibacter daejeonensis]